MRRRRGVEFQQLKITDRPLDSNRVYSNFIELVDAKKRQGPAKSWSGVNRCRFFYWLALFNRFRNGGRIYNHYLRAPQRSEHKLVDRVLFHWEK